MKNRRTPFLVKLFGFTLIFLTQLHLVTLAQGQTAPPVDADSNNFRKPKTESEAEYWLRSMVVYHGFSNQEITIATGWNDKEIESYKTKFKISATSKPTFPKDKLLILPYPGGRHPRIGFLDGALRPQRETKFSAFLPWDHSSFVVVDVPEAIWSNLGLTYLAHTHIPTIFDKNNKKLSALEWNRDKEGELTLKRTLPNKIEFTTNVVSKKDHIAMSMTLKNGTDQKLSDLRVQNCVMLKSAKGYEAQTNENKRFIGPYVLCHDATKSKWMITCWKPNHRPWANGPCPCLHSDPKFPDCDPSESQTIHGWLSFYEGKNIDAEIERIEGKKWWK